MLGQRAWGFIVAVSCGFLIVATAQITDPVEEIFYKSSLLTNIVDKNYPRTNNAIWDEDIDLRNNLLLNILGELNPPKNVTLRLEGNPVCRNANILNIGQFCASESKGDEGNESSTNSMVICPIQACPTDDFFEYVPASPVPCYCAAPLRIGYRLKSPSFSYFPPYIPSFEMYLTNSLNLELYQLSIDSFLWEAGPRLRMYLKIFPVFNRTRSGIFNLTEIQRIRGRYTSWDFPRTDFFGPYELLNITLLGPYSNIYLKTQRKSISKGIWAAIIVGAVASVAVSVIVTLLVTRRHARYQHVLSRKHLSSKISIKIEGVKGFAYKEMVVATNNFNSSSQIGRGGYGIVYRGNLSDKTVVAIKRAEEGSLQGQKEFLTEIKLLSRLHHRNLVSLVGYCDEVGEQMLVYEFMPNGTLRDWLSDAEGTLPNHVSTVVKGTPGYLDPEYFLTHKLTDKSDVYSLGVVFLELLTGMRPISHGKNIVREVNMGHESGTMFSIIDSKMGSYPSECVERFVSLALACCLDKPEKRPSMLDVVRELENILKIMPEIDVIFSESSSTHSGKSPSSSSYVTRDLYMSSDILGSDLISGVTPTIIPR
ncbi:LRR receptor-like serine/threonine-protein kinase [Tripterygium wilfordii]|uniref:LRR receptor-like serine/threonine-protein kinase n=1 Tax=Tripterygium wilfordii TaxID=458696 RepID=A0A7J7DWG9_TRIWF|nr:LRR receptor-like serine/threonine-protein kinase [Tripterygium wilfordii]